MSADSVGWTGPPAGVPPEPGGIEDDPKLETEETEIMKMYLELEQLELQDLAENTAPGVKDDKPASESSPKSSKSGSSSKSSGGSKSFWEGYNILWKFLLVLVLVMYIVLAAPWIWKDDDFSPIREVWQNKRYTLLKPIGKGMFSTVYLAMMMNWQLCAVKALKIGDKTMEKDAKQEADYLKELDHENVVRFYDYWEETVQKQSTVYIAMEYCEGGTLSAALSKLAPERLTRIETGLTKGINYIHKKGIAHRDIKSDNILVDWDGTPKYADFGIAKRLNTTTEKTDMNGLKTVLGEVQRHLTNASREVNTLTRMREFIEPRVENTLSSVSQLSAGMQKMFI